MALATTSFLQSLSIMAFVGPSTMPPSWQPRHDVLHPTSKLTFLQGEEEQGIRDIPAATRENNIVVPDTVLSSKYSLRQTLGVPSSFAAPNNHEQQKHNQHSPTIVGHRGALYEALENTREAFLKCRDTCDAVELDVFVIPYSPTDDTPTVVVFHGSGDDQNPGLLQDYCLPLKEEGRLSILDLTYTETQQEGLLQFNTKNPEFPCPTHYITSARIPTLATVLEDLRPTNLHVKIELKGPNTVQPVLDVVESSGITIERCSYSSFAHDRLLELRKLRPDRTLYRTAALFDQDVPPNCVRYVRDELGANEVHLRYDTCTKKHVDAIRAAGLRSMAWFRGPVGMRQDTTVAASARKYWDVGNEDELCYQAVMDTGVDEMCVNRPDVLRRMTAKSPSRGLEVVSH